MTLFFTCIAALILMFSLIIYVYFYIRNLARKGEKILKKEKENLRMSAILADENHDKIVDLARIFDNIDPSVKEVLINFTVVDRVNFVKNALDDTRIYPHDIKRILNENEVDFG